jgi:hypothetical protein
MNFARSIFKHYGVKDKEVRVQDITKVHTEGQAWWLKSEGLATEVRSNDHGLRPAWRKSLREPISTNNWEWWCMSVILKCVGSTNRRTVVSACPGIK